VSRHLKSIAAIVAVVLAVAVVAVEADALNDEQDRPPMMMDCPPPHPPEDRPPCMEKEMTSYAPPECPPTPDGCMKEEPPADGPVIVFDASGIPAHSPDKIKGYADAMEKREKMNDEKEPKGFFIIFDPSSKDDQNHALSEALEAVGFQVISDLQEMDGPYTMVELSPDNIKDSRMLYRILLSTDENYTELLNLIHKMIMDLENYANDDKSAALSREDEEPSLEPADSVTDEEDDSDSGETVYVVLAAPSAVETYLCLHVFDGGAVISQ